MMLSLEQLEARIADLEAAVAEDGFPEVEEAVREATTCAIRLAREKVRLAEGRCETYQRVAGTWQRERDAALARAEAAEAEVERLRARVAELEARAIDPALVERARALVAKRTASIPRSPAPCRYRFGVCPACGGTLAPPDWTDTEWLRHGYRRCSSCRRLVVPARFGYIVEEAARLRRALEWLAMKIADYGSCPLESEWKDAEGNDVCFAGLDGEDCPGPAEVWRCYVNAALAAATEKTP